MNTRLTYCATLLVAIGCTTNALAGKPPEKWMQVEQVVNSNAAIMLRVAVDHEDHHYAAGESMTVAVKADRNCYLYLLYFGAGNQVGLLFPNEYHRDNRIPANTVVTVPSPASDFNIVARPPFGKEYLLAVASTKPLEFGKRIAFKGYVATLDDSNLKDMKVELKKGAPRDWAEARIDITTYDPDGAEVPRKRAKRVAVCIGISKYASDRVTALTVCHLDAQRMAESLKKHCQVDEVLLLTNAQATREAIERAIFKVLPAATQPGDEVFIFFSCHGGCCADTTGTKPDGLSKFLIPYDGQPGKPATMILDRDFARWIRELDGRQVGIILDNCYAGGMAKGSSRGIKGIGGPRGKGGMSELFLCSELRRAKAIGQSGVELLAACAANQIAWEMPAEDQGSVLTYHVLKAIEDRNADLNGDKHVSVGEVYRFTKQPIEEYVRRTFSTEQTPMLLDNANDGVYLKP
jgi:hypothetical protein